MDIATILFGTLLIGIAITNVYIAIEIIRKIPMPKSGRSWKLSLMLVLALSVVGFLWGTCSASEHHCLGLIWLWPIPIFLFMFIAPPVRAMTLMIRQYQLERAGVKIKPTHNLLIVASLISSMPAFVTFIAIFREALRNVAPFD